LKNDRCKIDTFNIQLKYMTTHFPGLVQSLQFNIIQLLPHG